MCVLKSRFQIEGRKMKYSAVTVASIPHIQSDFNFLVMGTDVMFMDLTLAVFAAIVRFPVQCIVPSVWHRAIV